MIRDRPNGDELRALAQDALARGEDAPLIARALAITEREARFGEAPVAACREALAALYGEGEPALLLSRLAAEIRAGAFDAPGERHEQVRRLLWAMTLQKLRESNPEYLVASGVEG